jgi:hypothetical protein
MAQTELFRRFDQLFKDRISLSRGGGRWGSHEVRVLVLVGGVKLRCAMDEEQAYWYEVAFPEGDRIRIEPGAQQSTANSQILESVLHENGAA